VKREIQCATMVTIALILACFNPVFSQTRPRKEADPPWSQKGRAKIKETEWKAKKAYAAKFANRLAKCGAERTISLFSGLDDYNIRLQIRAQPKEWFLEYMGPPCLIQRHPDRKGQIKAYFDTVETWYYANVEFDGGTTWVAIDIERNGYHECSICTLCPTCTRP
jgi:hypothetical protein